MRLGVRVCYVMSVVWCLSRVFELLLMYRMLLLMYIMHTCIHVNVSRCMLVYWVRPEVCVFCMFGVLDISTLAPRSDIHNTHIYVYVCIIYLYIVRPELSILGLPFSSFHWSPRNLKVFEFSLESQKLTSFHGSPQIFWQVFTEVKGSPARRHLCIFSLYLCIRRLSCDFAPLYDELHSHAPHSDNCICIYIWLLSYIPICMYVCIYICTYI